MTNRIPQSELDEMRKPDLTVYSNIHRHIQLHRLLDAYEALLTDWNKLRRVCDALAGEEEK